VTSRQSPDHYSYTVYADPETARTFEARRFGGPIGEIVAAGQARVLGEFLGDVEGRTILDVGTGTGRAALMLASRGARVTGVDASEEMLAMARAQAGARGLAIDFRAGDAHALPVPDGAFDAAVCLRVIMHTPQWRAVVGELCRVSRRRVVLDYPSMTSVALVESLARRAAYRIGARTEPYRVFRLGTIAGALAAGGFRIRAVDRQFVLPIALHRAIGSPAFTLRSERILARAGLLAVFGSPVTVVAERCES
jgi:SAM-dependent methyltransferase